MMDYLESSLLSAIVAVGLLEILKKWLPATMSKKWYTVIFAGVTALVTCISEYLPPVVMTGFTTLSVGTVGYNTIIKTIERIGDKLKPTATDPAETTETKASEHE